MASKLVNDADRNDGRIAFARRLHAAVERAGGVPVVAKATDLPVSTFHTWVNGTAEPKVTVTARIAEFLGISLDYLVTGAEKQVAGLDNQMAFGRQSAHDSVSLPLLAVQAGAGLGIRNDEGDGEVTQLPFSRALLRELSANAEQCHFIRARGDSMAPTIQDGSIVLVDTGKSKDREDGIYTLMVGEDVRIKRLAFSTVGGLAIMSDNPAYPDEMLGRGEIDQVKIVGKVAWIGRAP